MASCTQSRPALGTAERDGVGEVPGLNARPRGVKKPKPRLGTNE